MLVLLLQNVTVRAMCVLLEQQTYVRMSAQSGNSSAVAASLTYRPDIVIRLPQRFSPSPALPHLTFCDHLIV